VSVRRPLLAALSALIFCGVSTPHMNAQASPSEAQPAEHWTGKFAFLNFTGQRVALYVDGILVLDAILETDNWSTALSRYLEHPLRPSSAIKVIIDGSAAYDDRISTADIRTIYIDARAAPLVQQTDHPAPLLD
jgi:hypothetical protein